MFYTVHKCTELFLRLVRKVGLLIHVRHVVLVDEGRWRDGGVTLLRQARPTRAERVLHCAPEDECCTRRVCGTAACNRRTFRSTWAAWQCRSAGYAH